MKISANSNMYERSSNLVWEKYQYYLSGVRDGICCVVSSDLLSAAAKDALVKSFAALGYGKAACTFFSFTSTASDISLDNPTHIFEIIEGIDPLVMVITDTAAANLCAIAYRMDTIRAGAGRIFGRNTLAFDNFTSLLESDDSKQRAWKLLKSLPRFSE